MIEFKAEKKPRFALLLDGQAEITFTAPKSVIKAFEGLADRPLAVTVKEHREKRTLSQNSYLWRLLDALGAKLGLGKEEIYKSYIRDCGVFEILPVKNEAAERFINLWQARGLGWVCEDLGESKLDGYTKIIAYYGSSTYTTAEMKRVLDLVVQDCEAQGIQTMTLSEIMLLQNDND